MSYYFYSMIGILKETMQFKSGKWWFSLFLWVVFPITAATVLGWAIADKMKSWGT